MKFCKDCKHFEVKTFRGGLLKLKPEKMWGDSCRWTKHTDVDFVSGSTLFDKREACNCRMLFGHCGKKAKHFEPIKNLVDDVEKKREVLKAFFAENYDWL